MSTRTAAEELFSQQNSFGTINQSRYAYSFSGADAKLAAYYPEHPELISYLDSAHTLSVSVHEPKGQVRALGYRGIRGLTRSVRTIAGSLILIVVNDHPMRPLMQQLNTIFANSQSESGTFGAAGWSVDRHDIGVGAYNDVMNFENRLSTLLPPCNLLIQYVAENAPIVKDATSNGRRLFPGAGMLLQGVEFIDESITTSVNDIVSEITLSYIAKDFKPISANIFHSGGSPLSVSDIAARQYELYKLCYPSPPPGEINSLRSEIE